MLLAAIALHLSVQAGTPPQATQPAVAHDSTRSDTARRKQPARLPVTETVLASAFHDAEARQLYTRARQAHIAQDSSIVSYDAKVRQRFSVMAGIGKLGPDHLVYRSESAARVQWQRGVGAHIEMTGNRVAIPPFGSSAMERDQVRTGVTDEMMSPIPYFPGSESIWIGGLSAQAEVDPSSVIHPLAVGAEAYYTFRAGDSLAFRLGDGTVVRLRELDVRPRFQWANLAVGSLWFDAVSGQLVRAAYRLAAPGAETVSVAYGSSDTKAAKISGAITRAILPSGSAQISGIAVEYALYEGRFWLPHRQLVEGSAQMAFARVPVKFENSFDYASVNGGVNLPAIHVDSSTIDRQPRLGRPPAGLDTAARRVWRDSARVAYNAAVKARNDSDAAGLERGSFAQCNSSATRVITEYRYDAKLPVEVRIPCNIDKLIASPDLPASIYDPGEEVFGFADATAMLDEALTMAAQAPINFGLWPAPRYQYGLSMTRYNRVEGLSTGLLADQQTGAGYSATAQGRYGFGDRNLNGEFSLARTNLSKTIRLTGYKRLVSVGDWGDPLSLRASVAAKLFGRDEGFYYRASGAELLWTSERGMRLDWRAFTEQESSALQTQAHSFGSTFIPNIAATAGRFTGIGARYLHTFGLDPHGWRAFTDLRLEGAKANTLYGRGALDVDLTRELPGALATSVTLAGGSSVGVLPSQRRWFLGGTETIRGQSADTAQSGNAFWMARAELSRGPSVFRMSLLGDIGWAGDRTRLTAVGQPLSDVGIGFAGFDNLVHFDIARGLHPREQTRLLFYLNTRF
jgi:hypothetical protein